MGISPTRLKSRNLEIAELESGEFFNANNSVQESY